MELIDFQWSSVVPGLYLASDPVGVGQDGHAEKDCSPFTISEEGHGMDRLMITICHVGPINVNCSRGVVRHSVRMNAERYKDLPRPGVRVVTQSRTYELEWAPGEVEAEQSEDPDIGPISRKKVEGDDCPTWEEILPESWENKIMW